MPTNKNAIIRYQALDRCFSDFLHRYYMEDLIEACAEALYQYTGYDSVSRRTVFDDITFMESEQGWSIPLERLKDGKKIYYRYRNRDFSINKQELTANELAQLRTTILTISCYRGLPSNEWLEDVISNLAFTYLRLCRISPTTFIHPLQSVQIIQSSFQQVHKVLHSQPCKPIL